MKTSFDYFICLLLVLAGFAQVVLYQRGDANTRIWIDKHVFGIGIYSKDYPFKPLRKLANGWYIRDAQGKLRDPDETYYKSLRTT